MRGSHTYFEKRDERCPFNITLKRKRKKSLIKPKGKSSLKRSLSGERKKHKITYLSKKEGKSFNFGIGFLS